MDLKARSLRTGRSDGLAWVSAPQTEVADGSITPAKLDADTSEKKGLFRTLLDITYANLPDLPVLRDLAFRSTVDTNQIENEAVTTDKIADGSITNPKHARNSIGPDEIINNSIGENKIQTGAVTPPKIDSGAVTPVKLSPEVREQLVPSGGGDGQVLAKSDDSDYAT